jgi:EAL domain-containing protein (putative c-di-GMP-specific phosphodiesterase class I)
MDDSMSPKTPDVSVSVSSSRGLNSPSARSAESGIKSTQTPFAGSNILAQLAAQLLLALESNDIEITLQPKISLETFDVLGYEVLLRWSHATMGTVPTEEWIRAAETYGLMPQLTLWLITKVALIAKNDYKGLKYAINVSPSCLTENFARTLLRTYRMHHASCHQIEIELTESVEIRDYKELAKAVNYLRKKGVKVSLDDFGVGYSSLRTLMELEVDEIKIDKSIVQSTKESAQTILKSIAALAQEMGISLVFEGIETQRQLTLAKALGANIGQGYLFSRPQKVTFNAPRNESTEGVPPGDPYLPHPLHV